MNVLAQLDHELADKDWTMDEKSRYLYFRSCEIFSYDPRYFLCESSLKNEIYEQKINIEDLDSTWVVCSSYARYIYSILLKELLDRNCYVTGIGHEYVVMENSRGLEIVADGTYGYDFTRVKMGLSTYGYHPFCGNVNAFNHEVEKTDKKLGYLKEDYEEKRIQAISRNIERKQMTADDFLLYRMQVTKNIFDTYQNIDQFSDLEHCIHYLQEHLLHDDYKKVQEVPLFQVANNGEWEFMTIFPVQLEQDKIYYALLKENNQYHYQKILESDAVHYTQNMEGKNKQLIYHA